MHKKTRPIALHRETLRMLDPRELNRIGGGFSRDACSDSMPATKCGDQCVTYSCGPGGFCD